jgi:hypothetical protein
MVLMSYLTWSDVMENKEQAPVLFQAVLWESHYLSYTIERDDSRIESKRFKVMYHPSNSQLKRIGYKTNIDDAIGFVNDHARKHSPNKET